MTDANDILKSAYSRLIALRDVLGTSTDKELPSRYVGEFHSTLARLAQAGFDVEEFKVATEQLRFKGQDTGFSPYLGSPFEERYIDRDLLLIRINSALANFELSSSEKARPVGFKSSRPREPEAIYRLTSPVYWLQRLAALVAWLWGSTRRRLAAIGGVLLLTIIGAFVSGLVQALAEAFLLGR